jgi:hypothetical protein
VGHNKAVKFRNKITASIVRAIERRDQGFIFDSAESIAYKAVWIERGLTYDQTIYSHNRDYQVMLELIKEFEQYSKGKNHGSGSVVTDSNLDDSERWSNSH